MSNLIVIGITGKARSGKDTVARHLVSQHGFFRISLADGPRSSLTDLDGPTWELRKELEAADKTSRWATQTIGTECREEIGRKFHWVDHLLIKVRFMAFHAPNPRTRFVVPDIRFPHEVSGLKAATIGMGGDYLTWKVARKGSGLTGPLANHESEKLFDEIKESRLIPNDEGLSTLRAWVDNAIDFTEQDILSQRKAVQA